MIFRILVLAYLFLSVPTLAAVSVTFLWEGMWEEAVLGAVGSVCILYLLESLLDRWEMVSPAPLQAVFRLIHKPKPLVLIAGSAIGFTLLLTDEERSLARRLGSLVVILAITLLAWLRARHLFDRRPRSE